MGRALLIVLAGTVGAAASCGNGGAFACDDDVQCTRGICAPPGYCAFEDEQCPSGWVFGAHAGLGLGGQCVEPNAGSGGLDDGQADAGPATVSGGTTSSMHDDTTHGAGDDASMTAVTVATDDGPGSGSDTAGGPGSTGVESPMWVSFVADIATCAFPEAPLPDPAGCEALAVEGGFTVDLVAIGDMEPTYGYLAFLIATDLPSGTVLDARLRAHTTTGPGAASVASGEIWATAPFTMAALMTATPAILGNAPLAPDQGAVGGNAEVTWPLPATAIAVGADLYFAIVPISTDGIDYWSTSGPVPPVLEVLLQP